MQTLYYKAHTICVPLILNYFAGYIFCSNFFLLCFCITSSTFMQRKVVDSLSLSLSLHNREALGEACNGDTAFADSLEAFGGGQDDPVSVSIGGYSNYPLIVWSTSSILSTRTQFFYYLNNLSDRKQQSSVTSLLRGPQPEILSLSLIVKPKLGSRTNYRHRHGPLTKLRFHPLTNYPITNKDHEF